MKKVLFFISLVVLTFLFSPMISIALLIAGFIYVIATTSDVEHFNVAYISFRKQEPHHNATKTKTYHDYQVEAFIANRQNMKTVALENTGLSASEVEILEDIENRLKTN